MLGEFFQSTDALTILGLPGLVLILAFLFYRVLVKSGIIVPLAQRQGFIILLAIIGYFGLATFLFAWLHSERLGEPKAAIPNAAAAPVEDELAIFFEEVSLTTPISAFKQVLGEPISEVAEGETSILRFSNSNERRVQLFSNDKRIFAITGFDPHSELKIPTVDYGNERRDGSLKIFSALQDFTLPEALIECMGQHGTAWIGRGGNFYVGPCRDTGSNGNYFYLFFFATDKMTDLCVSAMMDWRIAVDQESAEPCQNDKIRPQGFVVLDRDLIDGEDIEGDEGNLAYTELSLADFVNDRYVSSLLGHE